MKRKLFDLRFSIDFIRYKHEVTDKTTSTNFQSKSVVNRLLTFVYIAVNRS